LVRLVVGPEGEPVFDLERRAFGRGAWLHPLPGCLALSARGGFDRAFKRALGTTPRVLAAAFRRVAERRALGLFTAARRAKKLEAGSAQVEDAAQSGRAELVVVATDAGAAANLRFLEPLVLSGQAQAYGTKAGFGACLARPETALVAVTDARFAREIRKAIEWTQLPEPDAASARAARTMSSEAG
jgi:ribosomal protein L7Ae-like RNA K-turn-binding protein